MKWLKRMVLSSTSESGIDAIEPGKSTWQMLKAGLCPILGRSAAARGGEYKRVEITDNTRSDVGTKF